MPRCEGRPECPCPAARNDATVKFTQGDLWLCNDCDVFRFGKYTVTKTKSVKQSAGHQTKKGPARTASTTSDDTPTVSTNSTTPSTGTIDTASAVLSNEASRGNDDNASGPSDNALLKVNELLSYIQFYRDRANADAIYKVVTCFFHSSEISEAKQLLINCFPTELDNCQGITSTFVCQTCT